MHVAGMTDVCDMNVGFRDQELWYHSRRLIIEVFKSTAAFTDYNIEITNVLQHDCVAIASNIALAFGASENQKKTRYLQTVLKIVGNFEQHLRRAQLKGMLGDPDYKRLLVEIDNIKTRIAMGDSDRLN